MIIWLKTRSWTTPRRTSAKSTNNSLSWRKSRKLRRESKARSWNILDQGIAWFCLFQRLCCQDTKQFLSQNLWLSGRNSDLKRDYHPRLSDLGISMTHRRGSGCQDSAWIAPKIRTTKWSGRWWKSQNTSKQAWTHSLTRRMRRRSKRKCKTSESWRISSWPVDQLEAGAKPVIRFSIHPDQLRKMVKTVRRRDQIWSKEKKWRETELERESVRHLWNHCS